jgi:tRNA dimethylallyltransferase
MQPIIVICGATASGKSNIAIDVAKQRNGVIINADAMQVYRELSIITARPTDTQLALAEHRGYGVMSACDIGSAMKWLAQAQQDIEATWHAGKIPIITGGTGLYIKTLMEGLSPVPVIDAAAKQYAQQLWDTHGDAALKEMDFDMWGRLTHGIYAHYL